MTTSPVRPTTQDRVAGEIRATLARRKIRGVDLTDPLGMSQSKVSRKINGDTPWRLFEIRQLARHLGLTPVKLLGDALADLDEIQELAQFLGVEPEWLVLHDPPTTGGYPAVPERSPSHPLGVNRPPDNRPKGRPGSDDSRTDIRRPTRIARP